MTRLHFVPRLPEHLRGREDALEALDELLPGDGAAAVTPALAGQGGVGKTQLAVLYCHRRGGRFPRGVFWLSLADASPLSVVSQLAQCARAAGIEVREAGSDERLERVAAERWLTDLGADAGTLLVLDNLEDPGLLTGPLPGLPSFRLLDLRCHKLVTSRRADLPECRALLLGTLRAPHDHEALLDATAERGGARREPKSVAEEAGLVRVLAMLGGLPLALRLSGALMGQKPALGWARLAEAFAARGARAVIDESGAALPGYRDGLKAALGAVLAESWNALPEESDATRRVVEALAALPEARSWREGALRLLAGPLPEDALGLDEDTLPGVVADLAKRALVERPEAGAVRLHPLIWRDVRERAGAELRRRVAERAARAFGAPQTLALLDGDDWATLREMLLALEADDGLSDAVRDSLTRMRRTISPVIQLLRGLPTHLCAGLLSGEAMRRDDLLLKSAFDAAAATGRRPRWLLRWSAGKRVHPAEKEVMAEHTDALMACAFSPDGTLALSASSDRTLRLWEVTSGRCLTTLEGHKGTVTTCAFSPDGRLVLSTSSDSTLRLWQVANGQCRTTLEGHTDAVTACAFSPDGAMALSASADSTLRLWDVASGRCSVTLKGHAEAVTACAFSPDGRLALSASSDSTLRLWEVASGRCFVTLEGHAHEVRACAFSPDGTMALSASWDGTLRLWEVANGRCRATLEGHTGAVTACAFSPDGQLALSASNSTLRLSEVADGRCRAVLEGHRDYVEACVFSPDGTLLLSASSDRTLRVWEVATGRCRATLEGHTQWVNACAFSPDGRLALSGSFDGTLRLWDVSRAQGTLNDHDVEVTACAISPDDTLALSAFADGTLGLWGMANGRSRAILGGHARAAVACAFSPDGALALSADHNGTLGLWDVISGRCYAGFTGHSGQIEACAFTPDGALALSLATDGALRLWELASGRCRAIRKDPTGYMHAFSSDGTLAISQSHNGKLRLWDVASGHCRATLDSYTDRIERCVFSPDGRIVLSASGRILKLWDVEGGHCRATLKGHAARVTACTFSPDGTLAISASEDCTLRLWDIASGLCRFTLQGHTATVTACSVSPEGTLAVSAAADGTLRLWSLDNGGCSGILAIAPKSLAAVHIPRPTICFVVGDARGGVHCVEVVR